MSVPSYDHPQEIKPVTSKGNPFFRFQESTHVAHQNLRCLFPDHFFRSWVMFNFYVVFTFLQHLFHTALGRVVQKGNGLDLF